MSPSTPLADGIGRRVQAALEERGITSLFPIQQQVVPPALAERDVLAQSPTGSGKTLAFGIALVELLEGPEEGIGALVLVPTRELAVQVTGEIDAIARAHDLRVDAIYGGANINPQAKAVRRTDILVATPGRLQDLIDQRMVDLSTVELLVLDEADRMLDMGFAPQVEKILRHVPDDRQTMLFSATLEGAVGDIAQRHTHDAFEVRIEPTVERTEAIDHGFLPATREGRIDQLLDVLDTAEGGALVFVRTKRGADRLAKRLRTRGESATALHGDMRQSARLRELGRFERGEVDTMVATDVAARGIDLDDITLVVNYDPPGDADTYVHRTGRTARAGRSGFAITLVMDDQREDVQAIALELKLLDEYEADGLRLQERGRGNAGGNGNGNGASSGGGSRPGGRSRRGGRSRGGRGRGRGGNARAART